MVCGCPTSQIMIGCCVIRKGRSRRIQIWIGIIMWICIISFPKIILRWEWILIYISPISCIWLHGTLSRVRLSGNRRELWRKGVHRRQQWWSGVQWTRRFIFLFLLVWRKWHRQIYGFLKRQVPPNRLHPLVRGSGEDVSCVRVNNQMFLVRV